MRTVAGVLLAVTFGCTPLCKEMQTKTIYHHECKEQTIEMGSITRPVCVTHIEHVEIVTEKPVETKTD